MTGSHPLDVLFDAAAAGSEVEIPEGWGQGRAVYGGLVAGTLQAHALGAFDLEPDALRATTTSFVAPTECGPARLEAVLLRRGSSATQTEVKLWQRDSLSGEETVRSVQLSAYGADRESSVDLTPAPPRHTIPDPDPLMVVPVVPGITPEFFAKVQLRPAHGRFPFSGSTTGDMAGFMRLTETPRALALPHFIALVDAWPPAPGQLLRSPAAMSTLTWTLEMLTLPTGPADQHWWYEVDTDAAHNGYAHTHAHVFTRDGAPVAISRQTITIFG